MMPYLALLLEVAQPCSRVQADRPAQYITYERYGEGPTLYLGDSPQRVWLRLHNNSSCRIEVFAAAWFRTHQLPNGEPSRDLEDGQEVSMDIEVTNPRSRALEFAYKGDEGSIISLPAGQSAVFSVPANHLKAGPVAVRFNYPWDAELADIEHRVRLDPKQLPKEVQDWLAAIKLKRH